MENKTLRNIEGYSSWERKAKSNYYQLTFDERGRKLPYILNSVDDFQRHFVAFWTGTAGSLTADHHYEVLSRILENPSVLLDPDFPPNYQFIKDHHIEVLVTIALGVEANMMFIEPGEQLFHIDPTDFRGNEELVKIAPPLTGPSPERIQQIIANFRQVKDFTPPTGVTITKVLPEMMKRIGIRITATHNKAVFLYWKECVDSYAIHRLVESKEFPHVIPSAPLNEVTVLVPSEYGVTYSTPHALSAISSLYETRLQTLPTRTIHRRVKFFDAFDTINVYFEVSGEPTDPNEVTRQLAGAGATMNAAELDEEADDLSDGGDMGDNNDYMDFPPDDVDPPVDVPEQPGDDMTAGPNDPQTPAQGPNQDLDADSNNGDSTDSEQNSQEAPTARKRRARRDDRNAKKRKTSSRRSKKKAKKSRHRSNSSRRGESGSTHVHGSPNLTTLEEFLRNEFDTLNTNLAYAGDMVHSDYDTLNTSVASGFDNLDDDVFSWLDVINENVGNGFRGLRTTVAAGFDDLNTNVNALNNNAAAGFYALNTNVATRFDAMDTNISALRAEIVNNRANQPQRGTEAGPQTNARGEGGAADALGAGAIPRPVISSPDHGQAESGEEAQAVIARGADDYEKRATFFCVFLVVLVLVYNLSSCYKAFQTDGIDASPSPDIQPSTIECEAGIEAAAAFCHDEKCFDYVTFYCLDKDTHATQTHERKASLKDDGNEIIAQYL